MSKIGNKISLSYSKKKKASIVPSYGTELVINGTFDTDTDWAKEAGWTISGGTANAAATTGFLQQDGILTIGKTYLVTYTVSAFTAGSVRVLCGSTGTGATQIGTGTFAEELVCGGDSNLYIDGVTSLTCSIDNVSVKEKFN